MPQLGHALIGLGIGAATDRDVRSTWLRDAWPGLCVVLAYGPDLLEWGLLWTPISVVHSVTASLLVTLAIAVLLTILVLWVARESWWLAGVAVAAWVSHVLADTLAGGVPLRWPFSHETIGSDYLELDVGSAVERLAAEVRWLLIATTAGLALSAWRASHAWRARGLALAATAAAMVGAAANWIPLVLAAPLIALVGLALAGRWPRPRWLVRNALALVPIWLMGGGLIYGWCYTRSAERLYRAGDYRAALVDYAEAARFRPVDGSARSMYMSALCYRRLGDLAAAHALYQSCLERFPECITAMYGLGLLYLNSTDPEYRRPAEAAVLFERVLAGTSMPKQRLYLQTLIDQACAAGSE